jgi:hypothetical protein
MITKSVDKLKLPDGEYLGIWNDDNVCVPFVGEDYHFEVDKVAPNPDTKVRISIYGFTALCGEY